ncbi:sucrase ferredoxin [Paenibacillus cremeus]|uniref:Sucrase ferredoxin n=1 Tax=Paenibacillus cremeus TaxID=2163881 RepID=A0A559KIK4_9BACL|nr:sucrase ferredoxin [Paenibacillus cremeus]TVY11970.1 hypothetical protein FPZ49_01445 [Paenibacillus cremeus]
MQLQTARWSEEEITIENQCTVDMGRCAAVSRSLQENMGGTASVHERYVWVEVPLPWEYDVKQSRHFPAGLMELHREMGENGIRFNLLACASEQPSTPPGHRRVLFFLRPAGPFAAFERQEYVVPEEMIGTLIQAVCAEKGAAEPFESYKLADSGTLDLFVCTHGSHDVCCGKDGYPFYAELKDRYSGRERAVRVWRASHFGGHRLAPTMIEFPRGRYWGHMTVQAADVLLSATGEVQQLYSHYRGWAGLMAYEQRVEREIWLHEGWPWQEYLKTGYTAEPQEDGGVQVRIDYQSVNGAVTGSYEAVVRETGHVDIIGCDFNAPRAYKQFAVENLKKLQPQQDT